MLRIFLTGEPCLWTSDLVIGAERMPHRQGRLAFTYLISERARPIPRDELAEVLWPDLLPDAHEAALNALISKLRSLLAEAGLGRHALDAGGGCYALGLPPGTWVDTEAAHEAVHEAESALRAGRQTAAYGPATVAAAILRRPLLPGTEGPWVEGRRADLRLLLVRALDVLADVHAWNGEPTLAVRAAEQAVALEPFRESGYRRLMRIHLAAGDRAQAVRVYERCRQVLAEELGVDPAPETQAARAALAP